VLILKLMAKLTGPLFSESAHGTLGDAITYSARGKRKQARYQRAQKDYETDARALQRLKFYVSSRVWLYLTLEEKDELEAASK